MPPIHFKAPPLRWTWSRLGTKISATLIWLALCAALLISFKMAIINGSILALLGACALSVLFFSKPWISFLILPAQRSPSGPRSVGERLMKGLMVSLMIALALVLAILNGHWVIGTLVSLFFASGFGLWYLLNHDSLPFQTRNHIYSFPQDEKKRWGDQQAGLEHTYSELTCHLSSGERVEGVLFRHKNYDPKGLHVVYFMGNCGNLRDHCLGTAIFPKATMHLWHNYLGTDGSTGSVDSAEDLMRAGAAQVEYLLAQGVHPNNILLYGHSMGGAAAVLCARYFHNFGHAVHCLNDRSFSSLGGFLLGKKPTYTHPTEHNTVKKKNSIHTVSWIRQILTTFLNACTWLFGWQGMNITSVYHSLPERNMSCVTIKEDEVIAHGNASLYSHLKHKASATENAQQAQARKKHNDAMKLTIPKGKPQGWYEDFSAHGFGLHGLVRKVDLTTEEQQTAPNAAESLLADINQKRFSAAEPKVSSVDEPQASSVSQAQSCLVAKKKTSSSKEKRCIALC